MTFPGRQGSGITGRALFEEQAAQPAGGGKRAPQGAKMRSTCSADSLVVDRGAFGSESGHASGLCCKCSSGAFLGSTARKEAARRAGV